MDTLHAWTQYFHDFAGISHAELLETIYYFVFGKLYGLIFNSFHHQKVLQRTNSRELQAPNLISDSLPRGKEEAIPDGRPIQPSLHSNKPQELPDGIDEHHIDSVRHSHIAGTPGLLRHVLSGRLFDENMAQ